MNGITALVTTLSLFLIQDILAPAATAQHEGHAPVPEKREERDTGRHVMRPDTGMKMEAEPGMELEMKTGTAMGSMMFPGHSMNRDGSGTGWLTDASPVDAAHFTAGRWDVMLHGTLYGRYTAQDAFEDGTRGDDAFDAPNWFMIMASHPAGESGMFGLRGMLSLDPITEGEDGYPLLFQTGETFDGKSLIDRQHPHDLFSELSATYSRRLGEEGGMFAYLAYPGEPAIGPVAFMHRPSARHNPDAPLSHHWQDASHIVFGVFTLGAHYGIVKVDGSIFTGREPDEDRFGFDAPKFDSYSLRLTLNPLRELSVQASGAYFTSPETLEPETDQWRTTASVIYDRSIGTMLWTNSVVWGMNDPVETTEGEGIEEASNQHSFLVESDLEFGRQAVYVRGEYVQKPAEELGLIASQEELLPIGTFTLGTARTLVTFEQLNLMLGAQGTVYSVPEEARSAYGDGPVSLEVYLRLSPTRLMHSMESSMNRSMEMEGH